MFLEAQRDSSMTGIRKSALVISNFEEIVSKQIVKTGAKSSIILVPRKHGL